MFPTISKLILIALLLLGQASTMAHELDLDAHLGGDICQICLLHSALDDAQPAVAFDIPVTTPDCQHLAALPSPLSIRTFRIFQSRAPPQRTTV